MYFHGCGASAASYYEGFGFYGSFGARATGLVEHAANNDMIVIFPQAKLEDVGFFENCWEISWKDERDHP